MNCKRACCGHPAERHTAPHGKGNECSVRNCDCGGFRSGLLPEDLAYAQGWKDCQEAALKAIGQLGHDHCNNRDCARFRDADDEVRALKPPEGT